MNYITRLPKNKVSSINRNIFFQKKAGLAARVWRRVRDSNPRCWRTPVCSPRRAALRGPLQSRRFCGSAVRHRAAGRRDLPSAASAAQDGGSSKNGATIVHFIGIPAVPTAGAEPCSPVNPFFLDGNFSSAAFFENRREARCPFQKKAGLAARVWRRVRDSNPRCWRTPVFKTGAFDRSANSPYAPGSAGGDFYAVFVGLFRKFRLFCELICSFPW